jgi:RNA polymerase sigma-70 factor (ECF subfamily)
VLGAAKVARLLIGLHVKYGDLQMAHASVNGRPRLIRYREGRLTAVVGLTVADGRVTAIDMVMNPDKLARVRHVYGIGASENREG